MIFKKEKFTFLLLILIIFTIGLVIGYSPDVSVAGYDCCAIYAHDCDCHSNAACGCDCTIKCADSGGCSGPQGQVCCLSADCNFD